MNIDLKRLIKVMNLSLFYMNRHKAYKKENIKLLSYILNFRSYLIMI